INGIDATAHVTGLDDLQVRFILNSDDRAAGYEIAGTLEVSGPYYGVMVKAIRDLSLEIPVVLDLGVIGQYDFVAHGRLVRDCGCMAEVKIERDQEVTRKYEELASQIITQGSF
ncbi:hypothetical protein RZS08_40410, partial [Arthrospira platensis SPKY1]|nr:hypothetical protein [Arthrospira platensis SPKY1]